MNHGFILFLFAGVLLRGEAVARNPIEEQVASIAEGPQMTVVHFWASWCPNGRAARRAEIRMTKHE